MQYTVYTLDLEHIICKLYILIMHSLVTVAKIILFYMFMFKWDPRIYILRLFINTILLYYITVVNKVLK